MKKIIKTLGVTLILAVTFFNVSSILQFERDINLASLNLIQSANAESSSGGTKYIVVNVAAQTTTRVVHYNTGQPNAYSCVETCNISAFVDCWSGGFATSCTKTTPTVTCTEKC